LLRLQWSLSEYCLFDYARNRTLTSEEVKSGVIVGLLRPSLPKIRFNFAKILLLFLELVILFIGILGGGVDSELATLMRKNVTPVTS